MKMLSRSQSRLQDDKDAIVEAAEELKRRVDVLTWVVDNTQTAELWKAFDEVDQFGVAETVFFNAARVGPSTLLEFASQEISELGSLNLILPNCGWRSSIVSFPPTTRFPVYRKPP
jgi:NAD(P)-dependent dehydrogenase (short-subunit alcohol dehydrogenase family)